MNNYKFIKIFTHDGINVCIEFSLLNDKYIAHRIYKDEKQKLLKELDKRERAFYDNCYFMYTDFLDRKGIEFYKGGEQ